MLLKLGNIKQNLHIYYISKFHIFSCFSTVFVLFIGMPFAAHACMHAMQVKARKLTIKKKKKNSQREQREQKRVRLQIFLVRADMSKDFQDQCVPSIAVELNVFPPCCCLAPQSKTVLLQGETKQLCMLRLHLPYLVFSSCWRKCCSNAFTARVTPRCQGKVNKNHGRMIIKSNGMMCRIYIANTQETLRGARTLTCFTVISSVLKGPAHYSIRRLSSVCPLVCIIH